LIAAFWAVVFSTKAIKLADQIYDTKPTLKEWVQQKTANPKSIVEQAFKCFFLNRTSFSGSLSERAGPIGGYEQKGEYRIDCRYNSEKLAERVLQLSKLRHRVDFARCQSWKMTVAQIQSRSIAKTKPSRLLWYLDPPFFEKADRLYRYYFQASQHSDLAEAVEHLPGHWVLSYDDNRAARGLYSDHAGFATVNLQYNARVDDGRRTVASEILVSNLIEDLRDSKAITGRERLTCPRRLTVPLTKSQTDNSISLGAN
jgi:DNA adenine methylase